MKIICIGRNYIDHAKELNNPIPDKPVFFLKPDSAILRNYKSFYIPDFSSEIHYETELIIKISRLGKNISKKFSHRYYSEIGLGIDFTARDLQRTCKEKGLPWEVAKAFDGSAAVGDFISLKELPDRKNINFSLQINREMAQQGISADMIFSFDEIIEYVSRFMTLKIGDLIYTGTPAGVSAVKINDHLEGFIEGKKMLDIHIK